MLNIVLDEIIQPLQGSRVKLPRSKKILPSLDSSSATAFNHLQAMAEQTDLFSQEDHSSPTSHERITQLRQELHRHNTLYYNNAAPEISDSEFDRLLNELKDLEAAQPELHDPNSPTQRVGGEPLDGFKQREHLRPMLSIEDIHELKPEELNEQADLLLSENLNDWLERFTRSLDRKGNAFPLSIEPKIDGVAVTLIYRDQQLAYALTRGDGSLGDDITQNVRTIQSIPLTLPDSAPDLFEVRGEIFMANDDFLKLNEQREVNGDQLFVNPRNATAGTLKQLDPKLVAVRPLDCIFHSYGEVTEAPYETVEQFQQTLSDYGLQKSAWFKTVQSPEELHKAIADLNEDRHHFAYATDGAVIKVNQISLHETLGATSKFPRWACAFKFLPEQKETLLRDITIQVGRTGKLTPVAELEPVFVSSTTVSRATLHNQSEISDKDIHLGDTVIIEKAGEIIPAVIKVNTELRPSNAKPYNLLESLNHQCPSCSGPIEERTTEQGPKGNTRTIRTHFCNNFACPAQAVTRIKHFASRKALDLDGLGESVAQKLIETQLITTPLDLFRLSEDDLANLMLDPAKDKDGNPTSKERRFGEKRSITLLASLEKARKEMPLNRWLFAMGINNIGESTAKELARLHQNLSQVNTSKVLPALADLPNYEALVVSKRKKENPPLLAPYQIDDSLGPVAAASLITFFTSQAGQQVLNTLSDLEINPTSNNYAPEPTQTLSSSGPLNGKTFVITGTLSQPRDLFKDLIEQNGGKVTGSLSQSTDYLLAGEKAGSKLKKAAGFGTAILNEEDFKALF